MSVPALRFPEFSGEWEEVQLDKLMSERNIKAPKDDNYPLMAFVARRGVSPKGARYNRDFLVSDEVGKKYKRTEAGDFIYSSNNLETGSIGLNGYGPASISPVYSIFQFGSQYDHGFLSSQLVQKKFIAKMIRFRQGVVYGQWRIHESDFLKIKVCTPSLPEQKKIAAFLGVVDEKLAALRARGAGLETYKRGLMQKLFSRTLRFTKPDGSAFPDWEEKRLGDWADCLDNQRKPLNSSERQTMQGQYPYFGANGQVDSLSDFIFDQEIVLLAEDGGNFDEFTTRPIAQYFVGKCWVNNHAHILSAKKNKMTNSFLFYSLVHRDIRKYINGSSRAKLNKGEMLAIVMEAPHPYEQALIADALQAMDAKVSAVTDQIARMEAFKKGLLQQMFV